MSAAVTMREGGGVEGGGGCEWEGRWPLDCGWEGKWRWQM